MVVSFLIPPINWLIHICPPTHQLTHSPFPTSLLTLLTHHSHQIRPCLSIINTTLPQNPSPTIHAIAIPPGPPFNYHNYHFPASPSSVQNSPRLRKDSQIQAIFFPNSSLSPLIDKRVVRASAAIGKSKNVKARDVLSS